MKRLTILCSIALMVILIMSDGCKKDDDKVLNKITVAGNGTAAYNKDYIPSNGNYASPVQADCQTILYFSSIWVDFEDGSALQVYFYHPALTTTIPTGTFVATTSCLAGFRAYLYPNVPEKIAGLLLSSGTITISKSGDVYDVDIDTTIDIESGSGTLKGNFNGTLTQLTIR